MAGDSGLFRGSLGMFMATLVVHNKVDIKKISHVCFNMF